jgi:hypothetical protein
MCQFSLLEIRTQARTVAVPRASSRTSSVAYEDVEVERETAPTTKES